MGAAQVTLVAVALAARTAHADRCTGETALGGRFATCFDLGNRLSVTAGSNGFGGALALRHEITFDDDPDLEWKMEHVMVDGAISPTGGYGALLYRGRYIRHARDGHIVIPLGTPKKVFLPFDIGALAEVGRVAWQPMQPTITVGVVRTAPLVDFARARDYKRMIAIGPVAHWDMEVDRDFRGVTQHVVAPFTEGLANARLEDATGLTSAELRVEAGTAWRSDLGRWKPEVRAQAWLERIVLAVNDRPIALTASVGYDSARAEATAAIGARIVLFDRTDPRVRLDPLGSRHAAPVTPAPAPAPAPPPQPAPPAGVEPSNDPLP